MNRRLVLFLAVVVLAPARSEEPTAPERSPEPDSRLAAALTRMDPTALASLGTDTALPGLHDEAAELERLLAQPAVRIPIQQASLAACIALIADTAGMSYIAPHPEDFAETVSLSTRLNPYRLLLLLAEQYRFGLRFEAGAWRFTREPIHARVARTYELRHANLDRFRTAENSVRGTGGEGSEGEAMPSAAGLVFTPGAEQLVEHVRQLIGLRSTLAATQVAAPGQPLPPAEDRPRLPPADEADTTSTVLYLPDSNSLYVVATREQHGHVEAYLRSVDRPVRQVRIQARFIETSHDPQLLVGLNPEAAQPTLTLGGLSTGVDLNQPFNGRWPGQALLSATNLAWQLNALQRDSTSRLVNDPEVVTANNREVYLSVGTEEPFVQADSISLSGAEAALGTARSRIAFRRVGTTINVTPTIFEGDGGAGPTIRLVVKVEVGAIAGFRRINNVEVPRVASQQYVFTVHVPEGHTLAFGGLSGVTESDDVRKVPVLGDVPLVGYVFKSRDRRRLQRNLVAYVTPTIVPAEGFLAERPEPAPKAD